ncbi:divergent polysaccharide deacetylase family protein [Citreimonas sp.]|uniref:divergent polysaccharide deacetylase family protein n=1 Tax=Citreimonas sp. TaxID=3036715 RepID=UPI0035C7F653
MVRGFIAGVIGGSVVVALVAGAASLIVGLPGSTRLPVPDRAGESSVQSKTPDEGTISGGVDIAVEDEPESAVADGAAGNSAVTSSESESEAIGDDVPKPDAAEGAADDANTSTPTADQPGRLPQPDDGAPPPDASSQALPEAETRERPASVESQPPATPEADTAPSALPQALADTPILPAINAETEDGPERSLGQAQTPGSNPVQPNETPAQPPALPVPTIESPLAVQPETEPPLQNREVSPDGAEDNSPGQIEIIEDEDAAPAVADRPSIGEPATVLADRSQSASASRLPRIDDGEADVAAVVSPLVSNAAEAEVADEMPLMAVLLIDDGRGPLGPDALQAFPFPVSFAIDPSHPNAARAAQAYRDLGFEVLALADLPDGASPQDVEVTLAGALDAVPQAVAILEAPDGGLQAGNDLAEQVASFLSASGHGLVSTPNGLNTAQQIAARDGVPSTTLFRDFDGEGQDARVIRRFLDQGAFRARQEGATVMLGRLRADTISALVLWGLQDRAQSVALVPISVVLRETQDD